MKPRISPTLRSLAAMLSVLVAAVALGACGGSSRSTPAAPATVAASGHAPSANVAIAHGTAITFASYSHWLTAAETSATTAGKGKPSQIVVPLWPPDFSDCISQARSRAASLKTKSDATLRADCRTEFTELNQDTLDFLIESAWYLAYAHKLGIDVSAAQVQAAYAKERSASFKTAAAYSAFLADQGETDADIRLRTRLDLTFHALLAHEESGIAKPTTKQQQTAAATLNQTVEKLYRSTTRCAPAYRTPACGA